MKFHHKIMEEINDLKSKLPVTLYELLLKVGIDDARDLIVKSDTELQNLAPFSINDLLILKKVSSEIILSRKKFITGLEMHLNNCYDIKKLSTGCLLINEILDGGIKCKGLTELSGESRAGKTQFCLQLCLTVQYPQKMGGLNAGAVFICTEDVFPSKRLQQLFETFPKIFCDHYNAQSNTPIKFADNIYIDHAVDYENLVKIIVKDIPLLIASKKIGLIVVDSIAAVFRIESVSPKRSYMLREIGITLHKLANDYGIAVVCINQVSSNINNKLLMPCLGLSWANLVTTRIQLHNNHDENCLHGGEMTSLRTLRVIFDPCIPSSSIFYKITEAGVQGIISN